MDPPLERDPHIQLTASTLQDNLNLNADYWIICRNAPHSKHPTMPHTYLIPKEPYHEIMAAGKYRVAAEFFRPTHPSPQARGAHKGTQKPVTNPNTGDPPITAYLTGAPLPEEIKNRIARNRATDAQIGDKPPSKYRHQGK
jgi:hypothetical protein